MTRPRFTNAELAVIIQALNYFTVGDMADVGLEEHDPEHQREWEAAHKAVKKAAEMRNSRARPSNNKPVE